MSAEAPETAPARAFRWPLLASALVVAIVLSSFGVIYAAHESRELFRQLEQARRDENEIQIEWRQLLLERGTLSSHARVEAIANSELQMVPVGGEFRMLVVEQ